MKAGKITSFIMKKLILRLEDVINDEEKVTHKQIADQVSEVLEKGDLSKFKSSNPDFDFEQVDNSTPLKI